MIKEDTKLEYCEYACLGFDAENVIRMLKQKKANQKLDNLVLDSAYQAVEAWERVIDNKAESKKDYSQIDLDEQVYKEIVLKDLKKVDGNLEKEGYVFFKRRLSIGETKGLLKKIKEKEAISSEEIERGIAAFKEIVHYSLEQLEGPVSSF